MTRKYVYLGRFSPFHLGHEMLLKAANENFGEGNCLIMVGSSNSLNERTPYSFESRVKMIKTIFPNVEVIPLPDVQPEKVLFDGSTNTEWLDGIKKIADQRDEEFVFVGGCAEDLEILAERFKTHILVNREVEGKKMSATKIREALRMINPAIANNIISFDYK